MKTVELENILNDYVEIKEALGKYGSFLVYKDDMPLFVLTPYKENRAERIEVVSMDEVLNLVKDVIKENIEAIDALAQR